MANSRIIGIDFGHVRIGVSISDPSHMIASPLVTAKGSKKPEIAAQNLARELGEVVTKKGYEIERLVIGLPLHFNGSESIRCQEVRLFADHLEKLMHLPVSFVDERLTSVQAERSFQPFSRKKRSQIVDTVSSTLILQSFLDKEADVHPSP